MLVRRNDCRDVDKKGENQDKWGAAWSTAHGGENIWNTYTSQKGETQETVMLEKAFER